MAFSARIHGHRTLPSVIGGPDATAAANVVARTGGLTLRGAGITYTPG